MNEHKKIVSLRISDDDRSSIQSMASRLYIRESDIYRFAINQLLTRFDKLLDESCSGRDLLPLFLEYRDELNHHMNLKKKQLHMIFNSEDPTPETYVSMADIELLLLPHHALRQRLSKIQPPPEEKIDTDTWLKNYFAEKYFADVQPEQSL